MDINLHGTRRPESVRGEVGADGVAAGVFNTYIITIVIYITRAGSACARVNESLLGAFQTAGRREITIFEFRAARRNTHTVQAYRSYSPADRFFFPIIFAARNIFVKSHIPSLGGGRTNASISTAHATHGRYYCFDRASSLFNDFSENTKWMEVQNNFEIR